MYSIYQIDEQLSEKILRCDITEDKFPLEITDLLKNKYCYKIIEGISTNDIKPNPCFKEQHYLVVNNKQIQLVEKFKKINEGYLYNTSSSRVKILFTWKLVMQEIPFNKIDLVEFLDIPKELSKHVVKKFINEEELNKISINAEEDDDFQDSESDLEKNISLIIKPFDFDMKKNQSILIIGKNDNEKSQLIMDFVNRFNDDYTNILKNKTLFVTSDVNQQNLFSNVFPKSKIMSSYDEEEMYEYINDYIYDEESCTEYFENRCIVIDESVINKKNMDSSHSFIDLIFNGRHSKISLIYSTNTYSYISPEIKYNFDHIFIFEEEFIVEKKRIFNNYCQMFSNYKDFEETFDKITKDQFCMVIKVINLNKGLNECIFKYKTNIIETQKEIKNKRSYNFLNMED